MSTQAAKRGTKVKRNRGSTGPDGGRPDTESAYLGFDIRFPVLVASLLK